MRMLTLVLATLLLAGCGGSDSGAPRLHPVSGTVTYNGEPLANAQVTMIADNGGTVAVGQTDGTGAFTVTTKGEPGAVTGQHKVAVVAMEDGGSGAAPEEGSEDYALMMAGETPQPKSRIPEKYSDVTKSGLTASVEAGEENTLTLELAD
ncbi:hypothetical protein Mal4_53300 [Maioricimonas rarisocia]|uniref:Carboxypeptidase regulatory-like domain-containing protein n=1 Tax=Maioricimonas rarisocia TaxID=2528026 RepID=A0A517ZER8_9PLAN|nr:carboxypeptidase-like regulatory domain-containing protein [Maioricimonas rarisocia]QDU40967.1 hypothetical protein Mal4_53300 [Maioricimonas rarisocia]